MAKGDNFNRLPFLDVETRKVIETRAGPKSVGPSGLSRPLAEQEKGERVTSLSSLACVMPWQGRQQTAQNHLPRGLIARIGAGWNFLKGWGRWLNTGEGKEGTRLLSSCLCRELHFSLNEEIPLRPSLLFPTPSFPISSFCIQAAWCIPPITNTPTNKTFWWKNLVLCGLRPAPSLFLFRCLQTGVGVVGQFLYICLGSFIVYLHNFIFFLYTRVVDPYLPGRFTPMLYSFFMCLCVKTNLHVLYFEPKRNI